MKILLISSIRVIIQPILFIDGMLSFYIEKILNQLFKKQSIEITGTCLKRGACCKKIAVGIPSYLNKAPYLKVIRLWYEIIYNFKYQGTDALNNVIIFSCNYLKEKKCGIYWRRPYICRKYPFSKHFIRPTLLPGCGYIATHPD